MMQFAVFSLLLAGLAVNASPVPKQPANAAAEVRRLVHHTNWASVATNSKLNSTEWPMANLLPTADIESTGEIFFFMLPMDMVAQDTKDDKRITFMFSDAQEGDCNKRNDDPWSHKCSRTMISGKIQPVEKDSDEYNRGMSEFRKRHGFVASWEERTKNKPVSAHDFYLCKLEILNVIMFPGGRGGYKTVGVDEYAAGTDSVDVGAPSASHH